MNLDSYPFFVLYSAAYRNISGQVLECENQKLPPNFVWNRLIKERYLSPDQIPPALDGSVPGVSLGGPAVLKLIELGYINHATYVPYIPQGYLYLQSEDGSWFQVHAVEDNSLVRVIDGVSTTKTRKDNRKNSVAWQLTRVNDVDSADIINYSVKVPKGIPVAIELDAIEKTILAAFLDSNPDDFVFEKRPQSQLVPLARPLAIPVTSLFVFGANSDSDVRLLPSNDGELLFEAVAQAA